jgi:hypothetical protein
VTGRALPGDAPAIARPADGVVGKTPHVGLGAQDWRRQRIEPTDGVMHSRNGYREGAMPPKKVSQASAANLVSGDRERGDIGDEDVAGCVGPDMKIGGGIGSADLNVETDAPPEVLIETFPALSTA